MLALHETGARPTPGRDPGREAAPEEPGAPEQALLCGACGDTVTSTRHRIEVQGAHDHRFMNPGGFLYHVGCFADAVGCVVVGPDSLEYPWFAGFAWRCAYCGGCRAQLGWHFRDRAGEAFFGLILDRLREGPAPGPPAPSTPAT